MRLGLSTGGVPDRIHKSVTPMLRDLDLEPHDRSGRHQLLRDFYEPCLANATDYARGVGYLTSTSMAAAARGLRPFLDREGRMRPVASPSLTEEDAAAIRQGYEQRERIIEAVLLRELDDRHVPDPIRQRLEFLAWLIAEGRLDIKIALVEADERTVGIYHEKVGIFRDNRDDIVVFTGSANESVGGLIAKLRGARGLVELRRHDIGREGSAGPRGRRSARTESRRCWSAVSASFAAGLAVTPPAHGLGCERRSPCRCPAWQASTTEAGQMAPPAGSDWDEAARHRRSPPRVSPRRIQTVGPRAWSSAQRPPRSDSAKGAARHAG